MDRDYRFETIRIALGEREYVIIGNVELGFGEVRRPIAVVVLIESQQAVLAVTVGVSDEVDQPRTICSSARASSSTSPALR